MRVALVYNLTAGGGVSPGDLEQSLRAAGHELAYAEQNRPDVRRAREERVDVIAVAGGDGTVGRAAVALAGSGLPLAILPYGTANNIARSLGVKGSSEELMQRWSESQPVSLDLLRVRGPWGERLGIEAVGAGVVERGIARMNAVVAGTSLAPEESLQLALQTYRRVLEEYRPFPATLWLDGERLEGEFLLIEVLNIRLVGAGLSLSAGADPSDGRFDVVLATERERSQLEAYLRARVHGRNAASPALPVRRARAARMRGARHWHLDDELLETAPESALEFEVAPRALTFLR
jgi:diacylglycerol kinase family enzyme